MRRWIFVHVPRTGGTSVVASLHPSTCAYQHPDRHASAAEVKKAAGALWYGKTLTFSVVRNPWDRALSAWAYQKAAVGAPEFADWVRTTRPLRSQWEMVSDGEQVLVQRLLRFERLEKQFELVAELTQETPRALARFNASPRPPGDYRVHFTDWMVERVAEQYPEDVARLGYRF